MLEGTSRPHCSGLQAESNLHRALSTWDLNTSTEAYSTCSQQSNLFSCSNSKKKMHIWKELTLFLVFAPYLAQVHFKCMDAISLQVKDTIEMLLKMHSNVINYLYTIALSHIYPRKTHDLTGSNDKFCPMCLWALSLLWCYIHCLLPEFIHMAQKNLFFS